MRYEVELINPVHGITLSSMADGEEGQILDTGFLSDANTEYFYSVLEGFQSLFLKPFISEGYTVSMIDNLLILIDNQVAKVFINETKIVYQTIARNSVAANQRATLEDVIGVISLSFPEISITDNLGIIFFFSIRWKRGLFFDFRNGISNKAMDNSYQLGIAYEQLLYSHIYSVRDDIWDKAFGLGWFPFISLLGDCEPHLKYLLQRIEENKNTDEGENNLVEFFDTSRLDVMLARIKKNLEMSPHIKTIERSIERYSAGDYISATNNIWPRVEGVLRYIYNETKSNDPKSRQLLDEVEDFVINRTESPTIFLPHKFKDYLSLFFYDKFDLPNGKLNISRNSIAHGVAEEAFYDKKIALLGLLMIDQLSFYLRRKIKSI